MFTQMTLVKLSESPNTTKKSWGVGKRIVENKDRQRLEREKTVRSKSNHTCMKLWGENLIDKNTFKKEVFSVDNMIYFEMQRKKSKWALQLHDLQM